MSSELENARREIREADKQIAELFEKRMQAVRAVAAYKKEHGLPILDKEQEKRVLERNSAFIKDETIRQYYLTFQQDAMDVSKQFQEHLIGRDGKESDGVRVQRVGLGERSYDIVTGRGILTRAGEYLPLQRKVLVVTDSGVPKVYAENVAACCREPVICVIGQGEENKNLTSFETLLRTMLENGFTRKDCVVAVGGGICGDLAGFAAASYMRGIDFYNIPTTVLSQVDSSIGGKTAINLDGIKNVVGAFYQPGKVLIDIDVLKTLDRRQISAGLAEALKMAIIFDEELFRVFEEVNEIDFEEGAFAEEIEQIIARSLAIKARVVEQDEKEQGLRRALNFGHTIGHGIESLCLNGSLYHGECVAMGMLPMCSPAVRERLLPVLEKLHLPTGCALDPDEVVRAARHDKKSADGKVTIVETDRIGTYYFESVPYEMLREKAALVARQ